MAKTTPVWGTSRRVNDALFADAEQFEFFQAIRLLLLGAGGSASAREDDVLRFAVEATLAFPASAVVRIHREPSQSKQGRNPVPGLPHVVTSFLGLIGASGVLPDAYTELALDQRFEGDTSFTAFFDIFHHRLLSLFYRAWEKHHFAIGVERTLHGSGERDALTTYLLDLIGMGTPGLCDRLPFRDEALLRYAGLLAQQPRSAEILRALLTDFFAVPVAVEQFLGRWHSLEETEQCALGGDTDGSQLGLGAVAGDAVWTRADVLRNVFGPLTAEQFFRFLPDGEAFATASALIRWYLGQSLDFEIQPLLAAGEVPAWCELGDTDTGGPRLGWSAWLTDEPFAMPAGDAIFAEAQLYRSGAAPCL